MKRSNKIILASVIAVSVSGAALALGSHRYIDNMSVEEKSDMISYFISKRLELNSEQEMRLEDLTEQAASVMQQIRADGGKRQQLLDQFINDQPIDQAALLQHINSKTETINLHAPQMVSLMAGFVDSLDAQQKAELKQMIEKRHQGSHHRGHRRFGGEHRWIDG